VLLLCHLIKYFYRYVPRKPPLVGGDESARNEISILIAGMPRVVRGQHHTIMRAITPWRKRVAISYQDIMFSNPLPDHKTFRIRDGTCEHITPALHFGVVHERNAFLSSILQVIASGDFIALAMTSRKSEDPRHKAGLPGA